MGVTQAITLASARHPWRVIAAWSVTAALALVAVGALLGDALTTEGGRPTIPSRSAPWSCGRKPSRGGRQQQKP